MSLFSSIGEWWRRYFSFEAGIRRNHPEIAAAFTERFRRIMPYVAEEIGNARREGRIEDERKAWFELDECARNLRLLEANPEKPQNDFSDFPWIARVLEGIEPPAQPISRSSRQQMFNIVVGGGIGVVVGCLTVAGLMYLSYWLSLSPIAELILFLSVLLVGLITAILILRAVLKKA